LWADTAPTDAVFSVGDNIKVNGSGSTYVAYLFAHDPLGPSGDGSDGLIACGSYTGTGAAGLEVNLGWEPQWFLMKQTNTSGADWFIFDNMRGFTASSNPDRVLRANASDSEGDAGPAFRPTATGVEVQGTFSSINASGDTYIYIAIRRGPMRAPTSGTEVFAIDTLGGTSPTPPTFVSGFPVDFSFYDLVTASGNNWNSQNRLTGFADLGFNTTSAEFDNNGSLWQKDRMNGIGSLVSTDSNGYMWMFRRAPGFFDVVGYSGNDTARTIQHNLGVVPEMIWVKSRSAISNWSVLHSGLNTAGNEYIRLDLGNAKDSNVAIWNGTVPTDTVFSVGTSDEVNHSYLSATYIAYLFATLPGVSKVGSYTGNGTSQTIDCGFTSGARFILIKNTNLNSNWLILDTARGIVSGGNDPILSPNTSDAEFSGWDLVEPHSSGFSVTSNGQVNGNGYTYIFLAIA
jgi:hypothetical protein